MATAFQQIEKIKQEYTDKYVVVDGNAPELARFGEVVGQVKSVNMSGRALVEFVDYHLNIGWFDIDLDYLKVVDKPAPKEKKPAAKKATAKPVAKKPAAASEKKLSPLEMARMQDAGAKKPTASAPTQKAPALASTPAKAGKMSTADILAMARGGAAAAPAVKSEPKPVATPEPEPTPAASGPTKVDRSSMSVAEMIAYCREKDAR